MTMRTAVVCLVTVLLACGGGEPVDTVLGDPVPDSLPPASPPPASDPEFEIVAQAQADLSDRIGVPADEITVVGVESVTWNDGSLGCPEPGMMYTQALVDGRRIVLESGDTEYRYHSNMEGPPFLCDRPEVEIRPGSSVTTAPDNES